MLREWKNIHDSTPTSYINCIFVCRRGGRFHVCREDARLCHVHIPLWTAASVESVAGVTLTAATASTESASSTQTTAVNSAPAWYDYTQSFSRYDQHLQLINISFKDVFNHLLFTEEFNPDVIAFNSSSQIGAFQTFLSDFCFKVEFLFTGSKGGELLYLYTFQGLLTVVSM